MPIESEPAWLVAKVDQRLALMKEKIAAIPPGVTMLMTPLDEPREGATAEELERWEFCCDNCGAWHPNDLVTGSTSRLLRGVQVVFILGACPRCAKGL